MSSAAVGNFQIIRSQDVCPRFTALKWRSASRSFVHDRCSNYDIIERGFSIRSIGIRQCPQKQNRLASDREAIFDLKGVNKRTSHTTAPAFMMRIDDRKNGSSGISDWSPCPSPSGQARSRPCSTSRQARHTSSAHHSKRSLPSAERAGHDG